MLRAMPEDLPLALFEKRRLLHGRGQEPHRARAAAGFVAAGRLAEALEFLDRGPDAKLLEEVRRRAVLAGDAFALFHACRLLRAEAAASEWRDLATRAEMAGRFYDAVNALERAGEPEKAEALRLAKCPEFRPFKPAGK